MARKAIHLTQSSSCADKLQVLADKTRLAVVEALMLSPRNVSSLAAMLKVEQSLLSHHLQTLRAAGLVEAERDGKAMMYRIAPGAIVGRGATGIDLGCCQLTFS